LNRLAQSAPPPAPYGQADDLRGNIIEGWRQKRAEYLDEASEKAVTAYRAALEIAHAYSLTSPELAHAEERLAFFTTSSATVPAPYDHAPPSVGPECGCACP